MSEVSWQDTDDPGESHVLPVLCLSPCSSLEWGNLWSSWIKYLEFPGSQLFPPISEGFSFPLPLKIMPDEISSLKGDTWSWLRSSRQRNLKPHNT